MDSTGNKNLKKLYMKPTVKIYGNITEMTYASSNKGRDDGGKGKMDKTF